MNSLDAEKDLQQMGRKTEKRGLGRALMALAPFFFWYICFIYFLIALLEFN